jgi:hypothetical protein
MLALPWDMRPDGLVAMSDRFGNMFLVATTSSSLAAQLAAILAVRC